MVVIRSDEEERDGRTNERRDEGLRGRKAYVKPGRRYEDWTKQGTTEVRNESWNERRKK